MALAKQGELRTLRVAGKYAVKVCCHRAAVLAGFEEQSAWFLRLLHDRAGTTGGLGTQT